MNKSYRKKKAMMREKNRSNEPIAVFLTDTHLKKDNLELVYSIFEQAFDLASVAGIKYVIHGGDFFTNRVGQNLKTLLTMKRILDIFDNTPVTMIAIPGNHDKTNQDSEESYLDIFMNYTDNFKLFDKEEHWTLDGVGFSFLPFFTNSYNDRLKNLKKLAKSGGKAQNVLITHIGFNGVMNNDGTEVEDGARPKDVKFWDKVLVGHYHDASKVGDNIIYTGSAYQNNFGENIADKGFYVIHKDLEIEFVPAEFPKYIKVPLDLADDYENEIEVYQETKDNIRFVFKGERSDLHKVDQQKLSKFGIDCKFEFNDINEEILKAEEGDFNVLDNKTIFKYFLEYCKIQNIVKDKKTLGLKILKGDESEIG